MTTAIEKTVRAASLKGDLLPRRSASDAIEATGDFLDLLMREIDDPTCQRLIDDITVGRELAAADWFLTFARSQRLYYVPDLATAEPFAEVIRRWVDGRSFEEVSSQLREWSLQAA